MCALQTLGHVLSQLEERLDPDQARSIRGRHAAALAWEPSERPPLVIFAPPAASSPAYPYQEAFHDPAKMMVNELVRGFSPIAAAAARGDDTAWTIRPNLGTGIVASAFGADVRLLENNMPWVQPLDRRKIDLIIDEPFDLQAGLVPRVIEQYRFFHEQLADLPRCRQCIDITLPDLQGPFDTAELLWGSSIFEAMYVEPDTVARLMARIAEAMVRICQLCQPWTTGQLGPVGAFQHACGHAGRLLIRADSVIMLSPRMYERQVSPTDCHLADALGGVSIHFCGDGSHQFPTLAQVPGLKGFDLGQSHLMEIDRLYAVAREHRLPLSRVDIRNLPRTATELQRRFPDGGVILKYEAADLAEAGEVWQQFVNG